MSAEVPAQTPETRSEAASPPLQRQPISGRGALAICTALLVLFGLLSFTAAHKKSATYDEPLHVVGGFMHRYFKDFRINPEDPALFGLWAALPHSNSALMVDVRSDFYRKAPQDVRFQWPFAIATLYDTRNNFADPFLMISRSQFMIVGVLLGVAAAWWSWKLGGAIAAVFTTTLYALDPNLTAHASIVKNDVATGLLLLALGYTTWQFGRHGNAWRLLLVALVCGAAVNMKFSGVLFGPIALVLLTIRAVMGKDDWQVAHVRLGNVMERVAAVGAMLLFVAAVVVAMTWAVYGFRFAALADGGTIDLKPMLTEARGRQIRVERIERGETNIPPPTPEEIEARPDAMIPRLVTFLADRKLLPQPWLYGFLYTYATTITRGSYLLGERTEVGWWYYFPMTMLFKTPLATLAAIFGGLLLVGGRFIMPRLWIPAERRAALDVQSGARARRADQAPSLDLWTLLCLIVPPAVYAIAAMASNLNLGVRHILPVYPYIFIALGALAAAMIRLWPKPATIATAGVAVLLTVESVFAYPNYLPFFNAAAGGWRGGLSKLADSNLDWGQDLPALANWQRNHTDRPLLFAYFGTANPRYYGIEFTNLVGGWPFEQEQRLSNFTTPHYVAISATNLQGVYIGDQYAIFRDAEPLAVLGGSIYVYEWPLSPTLAK